MAARKKKMAPSRTKKAPGKKTRTVSPAKGKTPKGPKSAKPVKKKALKTKALKKVVARKKATPKKKVVLKKKVTPKKATPKKEVVLKKKVEPKKKAISKKPAPKKATAIKPPKPDVQSGRLPLLRSDLIRRKEEIVREVKEEIAKYVSGENRQLVDTALDEGDWAVVDISEDINLRKLAVHRKTLHDIDETLRKIAEGTYGICEECGEEIGEKRLRVLPAAILCVNCQGNKEQLEALEKEETSL